MSAGRFGWEATRFEHRDEATGALLTVWLIDAASARWSWRVAVAGAPIDSGTCSSSSAAKGTARQALGALKVKRVQP